LRLIADGVISLSFFAGRVGEVMPIVVIHVVRPEILKTEERHKGGIARPKKGKRTTGSQRTVVDTV